MKYIIELDTAEELKSFMLWKTGYVGGDRLTVKDAMLTMRTINVLLAFGFEYLDQAFKCDNKALLSIPNMGRKSMNEIRELHSGLIAANKLKNRSDL